MRLLVFQHIAVEHPGILRDFLRADGIPWDTVELDEGARIPSFDGYDALIVMGGPMDVWQEADYPWLKAEKAAIREAVLDRGMGFFGVCLGHQLLAAALGGEVAAMSTAEVGILEVELTEAGVADRLFTELPRVGRALQWHGAEVTRPPAGAEVLARSPACAVQAMRVGRAYGLQYHVEITAETVGEWAAIPAYAQSLERAMGEGAPARLEREAARAMADFNDTARRLYDNFMSALPR